MATTPRKTSQATIQEAANVSAMLHDKWAWFAGIGVLLLIIGGLALSNLVVATVASVYFIGMLMLLGGIIEIIHAFGVQGWKSFLLWFLSGVLYALAGVVAFMNPILASAVLTFLLAAALLAVGCLRIWTGYETRHTTTGWGWIVATGVLTALAGLIIALGWPVNSLWILGAFLAIDLIFQGWSFIAFGWGLKHFVPTAPSAVVKATVAQARAAGTSPVAKSPAAKTRVAKAPAAKARKA